MSDAPKNILASMIANLEREAELHEREIIRCRQQIAGFRAAIEQIAKVEVIEAQVSGRMDREPQKG